MNNSQDNNPNKILKRIVDITFYFSILIFIIAFNFQDSRTGGWYQQFMPNLNGKAINDITFIDSLIGFAVTNYANGNSYILKTTNGGDNWQVNLTYSYGFDRISFINYSTGFANAFQKIFKTTNTGITWDTISLPGDLLGDDMFVLNVDTIWLADAEPLTGGLFRTTNGGLNWQRLTSGINQPYPDKLYFYNSRIGFATNYQYHSLYKTTNSGINWFGVAGSNGFNDIVFVDSLTGYKTSDSTRKSTDGGITWIAQKRPRLNVDNSFYKFALINKDTIWGVGGVIYTSLGYRGIVYKTTNSGVNWGYQIPDSINITIGNFNKIDFINRNIGWAYLINTGIHTVIGGNDTTFITGVNNNITSVSKKFVLEQNYPNPFNSKSNIKYKISKSSNIKIKIFDINGKEIIELVNKKQNEGSYEVKFDGSNLSSGIYFYSLFVNEKRVDTKKMLLIK